MDPQAIGSILLFAFAVGLFVFTATQVLQSPLSGVTKLVWVAAMFAYPLVGPAVWFWWGEADVGR